MLVASDNQETGEAYDYTYGGGVRWIVGHLNEEHRALGMTDPRPTPV